MLDILLLSHGNAQCDMGCTYAPQLLQGRLPVAKSALLKLDLQHSSMSIVSKCTELDFSLDLPTSSIDIICFLLD